MEVDRMRQGNTLGSKGNSWKEICHLCRHSIISMRDHPVCKAGRFREVDLSVGRCLYNSALRADDTAEVSSGGTGCGKITAHIVR